MYQPRHFEPHELLPGLTVDTTWGTLPQAQRDLLDDRLLESIDGIRDILGVPCVCNNYATGGNRKWSGYRSKACTIGAPRSQHRKGKAADLLPEGMTAEVARSHIKRAIAMGLLPHIGGIETGVSWLHIDTRDKINGKVVYFAA